MPGRALARQPAASRPAAKNAAIASASGSSSTVRTAPKDAFANLLPILPTARRTFARADRVTAFAKVYQAARAQARPVRVTARIVDAADRAIASQTATLAADSFAVGHASDWRFDLPLEKLATGEYLFVIEATQGQHTARRGVRFLAPERVLLDPVHANNVGTADASR